jgi:hypothetical protein
VSNPVIPMARSLFVCDFHVGYPDGRVDLSGILSGIRPAIYPHLRPRLVIYAQLCGGLGDVPLFFDIRRERDDDVIRTTAERIVRFVDRFSPVNITMTVEGIRFPDSGAYVVSLYCHNRWVCDTILHLE